VTLYTVNAPPPRDGTTADPADLVFIKDGFCWPALFFPEIWLIVRRLWLVLILYVVVAVALIALSRVMSGDWPGLLIVLARFLFALEANGLRRWTLERHGYRLVGVAEGRGLEEAELRFFSEWSEGASAPKAETPMVPPPPPSPPPQQPWQPTPEDGGVVGMFPTAGGAR
jgi:hypothetical protein